MQETPVRFLGRVDPLKRDRLPTPVILGFPGDSAGKESACNVLDLGSTPGLGRSPGEGKGYPLQYSGLENSVDCMVLQRRSQFYNNKKFIISRWLKPSASFHGSSDGQESTYNAGDPGSTPGLGRSPGEGNGNPLQYSCLENPMEGGAW